MVAGTTDLPSSVARVPNEKAFVFANAVLSAEVDVKMRVLWELLF